MPHDLLVEPEAVFEGAGFDPGARRPTEKTHTGGCLENVGGERAAVDVEFDAKIAGVGDPGDLVAVIEHHGLRNKSNEYGAFGHFSVCPHRCMGGGSPPRMSPTGR